MDRIDSESLWVVCPDFADVFVRCEAFERLEASAVIVGADEVGEVALQLTMAIVVIALDGGFLDRSVHAFDLAIRPRMLDLGQPMLNAILMAAHVKHVRYVLGRWTICVARRKRELNAVVSEYDVNLVGNGFDESHQESRGRRSACLLHKLHKGKLARPINRDIQI